MTNFILKLSITWWFPLSCGIKQKRGKVIPKVMTVSDHLPLFLLAIELAQRFWENEGTELNCRKREGEFSWFFLRAFCPEGIHHV